MKYPSLRSRIAAFILVSVLAAAACAHDAEKPGAVVIDTDLGLDDSVALAFALQHPALDIRTLVATPGAMDADQATTYAERLLDLFNRSDVELYQSGDTRDALTPALQFVAPALPDDAPRIRKPLSPGAYTVEQGKTTLIILGPLTSLATALKEQPEIVKQIELAILPGNPVVERNWNLRADPQAYEAVKKSGIPLIFVTCGEDCAKPGDWNIGRDDYGPNTSIGEGFIRKLLEPQETRTHYLHRLDHFTDELAVLYATKPSLFDHSEGDEHTLVLKSQTAMLDEFRQALIEGRQARPWVVFVNGLLPERAYRPEIRAIREDAIRKNGTTEWRAQVLLNEMHQHVGAYSTIGVKMGLFAAEQLNAPQHGMKVVSETPASPPVSCLCDGLIISTGSTPGRGLFSHTPCAQRGIVQATFEYNGRQLTLRVKSEYQQRIRDRIRTLLSKYTLADDEYWEGVEETALDIWTNWHRRDLFEVVTPK